MSIIISGVQPKIIQTYGVRAKTQARPVSFGRDSVEVSENGQLFANAMKAANEAIGKGADSARIAEISDAVKNGTYSVDGYALAGKITEPGEGWQA